MKTTVKDLVFIYLRIVTSPVPNPKPFEAKFPLIGATVQLLELDNPAPDGDDVSIDVPPDTIKNVPNRTIFDTYKYKPNFDEFLNTQTTELTGLVIFVVKPNKQGGQVEHNTTTLFEKSGKQVTVIETTPVPEILPDFGVTVTSVGGKVFATRKLIALNVKGNQVGSLENPVELIFVEPLVTKG